MTAALCHTHRQRHLPTPCALLADLWLGVCGKQRAPLALLTGSRQQPETLGRLTSQMTFVLVSTVYAVAVGEPSFGDVSNG